MNRFVYILLWALPASTLPSPENTIPQAHAARPAPPGIALVELFTSEGCSSCPPADEALAAIAKTYTGHAYVLAYHVDYWNSLGWKDPFSNAAWTDRQTRYATLFNLNSIYTPQAVVNGKIQFTGSDKSRLTTAIENELKLPAATAPGLEAKTGAGNKILVSCTTATLPGKWVSIALVQRSADTQVKRGENEGKKLHHVNIVRELATFPAGAVSTSFNLPAGLPPSQYCIIAFIQDKQTLAVTAAAEASIVKAE